MMSKLPYLDDELLLLLELGYALGVAGLLVPHERLGLVEPQRVELVVFASCLDAWDESYGGIRGIAGARKAERRGGGGGRRRGGCTARETGKMGH